MKVAMSDSEYPLPPATFEILTTSLKMQAEMQLGLLRFGDAKDQPEPDFRLARHSIDMLAMLEQKTQGNLTMEEKRLLENSLTELRFRYIQSMEDSRKRAAAEPPPPPEIAPETTPETTPEIGATEQAGS
jgi:hypothetical protein